MACETVSLSADQDDGIPFSLRLLYEMNAKRATLAEKGDGAELRKTTVDLIDSEIERLTELENVLETDDMRRLEYKSYAAIIPAQRCRIACCATRRI